MTTQEHDLLEGLTARVNGTQLGDKDQEAEQYLLHALGHNPDAIYILAQTVLVQQYALDQAKQQMAQLRQAAEQARQQPVKHTSFLGSLLGTDEPSRPAAPPPPPAMPTREPQYAPVQSYSQPAQGYGQAQYAQPGMAAPSGGGGFLRSAMQTATGVAAGAFAFEGIESLLHGFGNHAGYGGGSGFGGFGGGGGGREEVVNNYYGDGNARDDQRGLSPDLDDRRDDSSGGNGFAHAGGNELSGTDDAGTDDSGGDAGTDDAGSFDDSGASSGDDSGSFDDSGF